MKLKLKKDLVIPTGTVFDDNVPTNIAFGSDNFEHTIAFGKNASGTLYVGAERNDPEFQEWFEEIK